MAFAPQIYLLERADISRLVDADNVIDPLENTFLNAIVDIADNYLLTCFQFAVILYTVCNTASSAIGIDKPVSI